MDPRTSCVINGALVLPNFLLNLFFIYCLSSSSRTFKQPLRFLLQAMIFCSLLYLLCLMSKAGLELFGNNVFASMALFTVSHTLLSNSMNTSVWLSVFYCSQIVPAKRALFVWIKKNIKVVIFSLWLTERMWIVTDFVILSLGYIPLLMNSTAPSEMLLHARDKQLVAWVYTWVLTTHVLLSLCVMVTSSVSMSCYLMRHIRRMHVSGQTRFTSKFQGQLRVSLTGILQCFLYALCALWLVFNFTHHAVSYNTLNSAVHYTVINVYMFGTTLNMWAGQSVFRQRSRDFIRALKGETREDERDAGATDARGADSSTAPEDGL